MASPLARLSARRQHLDRGNPLRALTEVIGRVEGIAGVAGERQVYTPYSGLPGLREAIAAKLRVFNGLHVGADGIVVTLGSPRQISRQIASGHSHANVPAVTRP